ncbi:MAG: hypothetical protein ACYC2K_07350 [Gemmatimonadales bacterium]
MSELILGFIIGWAAAATIIGFGGIFLAKLADNEFRHVTHDLERATANHAADLTTEPTPEQIAVAKEMQAFASHGPVPISEATVPMLAALTEPCKGCGKRPIDLMEFS